VVAAAGDDDDDDDNVTSRINKNIMQNIIYANTRKKLCNKNTLMYSILHEDRYTNAKKIPAVVMK